MFSNGRPKLFLSHVTIREIEGTDASGEPPTDAAEASSAESSSTNGVADLLFCNPNNNSDDSEKCNEPIERSFTMFESVDSPPSFRLSLETVSTVVVAGTAAVVAAVAAAAKVMRMFPPQHLKPQWQRSPRQQQDCASNNSPHNIGSMK
jgi:hypothetical protein